MVTPQRSRTRAMNASLLSALRIPMVPTATSCRGVVTCASSTMPLIASAVRSIAAGAMSPVSAMPSPRRVTSARSTRVLQEPSSCRSPMWNLTELVPTSMTANTAPGTISSPCRRAALSHRG